MPIQLNLFGDNDGPAMHPRRPVERNWMKELIDGPPVPPSGGFAVVEDRERVIWGTGETGPAAIEDALKWLRDYSGRNGSERYDIEDKEELLCAGIFSIRPCSARVMRMVNRYGGEIEFMIREGRVVLPKENLNHNR